MFKKFIKKTGSQKPQKPAKFDFLAFVQRIGSLFITALTVFEKLKPYLPTLKNIAKMLISLVIGYFRCNDF